MLRLLLTHSHTVYMHCIPRPLGILFRSVFGMTVASVDAERSVCQYR